MILILMLLMITSDPSVSTAVSLANNGGFAWFLSGKGGGYATQM